MNKIVRLLTLLLVTLSFSTTALSQDNIDTSTLKIGIYKTEEEVLNNNPSILQPFSLLSDTARNGAIYFYSEGYVFNDSSKPIKKVFGFCDGKHVYVRIFEYENLFSTHKFYRLNHLGKFPFVVIRKSTMQLIGAPSPLQ